MKKMMTSVFVAAGLAISAHAGAEVVFYEHDNYGGRSFTTGQRVNNLQRFGFNDRASSAVVVGERWEACQDANFKGNCVILRPGRYPSLSAMGLNDRVSSLRIAPRNARNARLAPPPQPVYDNRRRRDERVYEVEVTSVRAVVGAPEQRCWMEREQVQASGGANIPGAVMGAIIGGVLGHQVGGGRGQDLATVGGAVAGGYVGSNVGRSGSAPQTREVQRCANTQTQRKPEFWDVTYNFRGTEHRVQMTTPPGRTLNVNSKGEPRA